MLSTHRTVHKTGLALSAHPSCPAWPAPFPSQLLGFDPRTVA